MNANLKSARVFEADLQLAKPLVTARKTFESRKVILLSVTDSDEQTGWGEAAPLEDWGSESYSAALNQLTEATKTMVQPQGAVASFAWDIATADLSARQAGLPLHAYWNEESTARDAIRVNATLGAIQDEDEFNAAASALIQRGFSCLKLKVGVLPSDFEIRRITQLARQNSNIQLRLDANGAWDIQTAHMFFEGLEEVAPQIEYIEQPTPVGTEASWIGLKKLGIPIAADESCAIPGRVSELLERELADVLVLKPMVMGSVEHTFEIVRRAQEHGVDVVFTSAIDSALARTAVAHLAIACGLTRACGLATGDWILADVASSAPEGEWLILPRENGLGIVPRL